MKKINIIQFLPYFPPHKGGLETVGEELGKHWVKNNFGEFINITTDFDQEKNFLESEKIQDELLSKRECPGILFEGKKIGYKKDGYEVLVVPSFEIINNFPVYKIWDKKYFLIKKYLKEKIGTNNENFRIFTHTRFFLTSFIGGIFARKNKIKWIHIEHGSDYVKLNSSLKNFIAKFYDEIVGKWIFKKVDKLVGVSGACKKFIQEKFVNRGVEVVYRGVDLKKIDCEKKGEIKLVFIGRLVKLKGVDILLKAYKKTGLDIELNIIGDGDEKKNLEDFCKKNNIKNVKFLGFKNKEFIGKFLSENKCVLINTSYQEGLPTSVIEGLFYENIVIASDVGGTSEISKYEDLILFKAGKILNLKEKILFAVENYNKFFGISRKNFFDEKFNRENNVNNLYDLVK